MVRVRAQCHRHSKGREQRQADDAAVDHESAVKPGFMPEFRDIYNKLVTGRSSE